MAYDEQIEKEKEVRFFYKRLGTITYSDCERAALCFGTFSAKSLWYFYCDEICDYFLRRFDYADYEDIEEFPNRFKRGFK